MASNREDVLDSLKLGEGISISGFLGTLTQEKVVAVVTEVGPRKKVLNATLYGINLGDLTYQKGTKTPLTMEEPR